MNEGTDMNNRTLVALDADDSYFNDWLIDLFSLERCASDKYSERLWTGVSSTYASLLIREN